MEEAGVRGVELPQEVEALRVLVAEGDELEEQRQPCRVREGLPGGLLGVRRAVRLEDHEGRTGGLRLLVVRDDLLDRALVVRPAQSAEARVQLVDAALVAGEFEGAGAVDVRREEDDPHGGVLVQVRGERERPVAQVLGAAVLVERPHRAGAVEHQVDAGAEPGQPVRLERRLGRLVRVGELRSTRLDPRERGGGLAGGGLLSCGGGRRLRSGGRRGGLRDDRGVGGLRRLRDHQGLRGLRGLRDDRGLCGLRGLHDDRGLCGLRCRCGFGGLGGLGSLGGLRGLGGGRGCLGGALRGLRRCFRLRRCRFRRGLLSRCGLRRLVEVEVDRDRFRLRRRLGRLGRDGLLGGHRLVGRDGLLGLLGDHRLLGLLGLRGVLRGVCRSVVQGALRGRPLRGDGR
ncbi:hypothetical protein P376_1915 [Streptomyces sp. HCCB10043]|nr:hypothetical protein P376_1915 [Streptomyces sp. HCCB10043]